MYWRDFSKTPYAQDEPPSPIIAQERVQIRAEADESGVQNDSRPIPVPRRRLLGGKRVMTCQTDFMLWSRHFLLQSRTLLCHGVNCGVDGSVTRSLIP